MAGSSGNDASGGGDSRLRAVILVSGGGISRSRRSDAMCGLSAALHPAASVAASGSCRRSVGHLSAVWVVGMLAAGSSGGQWWQSLPVVLCYACSYLPGVMLASGGSLCRGDGLRYLQHIGGGASVAVSRSVYRSSSRSSSQWRAAFRGVCLLHLPQNKKPLYLVIMTI